MVNRKNLKMGIKGKKFCHDCKKEIKIGKNEILNGKELVYDDNGEKITVLKCNACFDKNPSLNNFRKCEVYSRVVGYLRPVEQWNKGKKQEFKERKNYKTS